MKKPSLSLTEELKSIDKKIASLVNQRSSLICKISQIRQHRKESLADVGLEKELWTVWKKELKKSNQGLVRQLFTLLNSLGYSMAEKSSSDKPFCLYPPNKPINLNIPGPRSIQLSHCTAFLCSLSPEKEEIPNFLINDSIIELIKMANQCGSKLSWHENILTSQGNPELNMDGQNLFINHSLFNFYLFCCLALGSTSRIKFNSSSILKAVNLKDLQDFMPQLGARLNSIEPMSYSLPARLETSGQLPSEIFLPDHFDPLFVKALIMAACSYENGLVVKYGRLQNHDFRELFALLENAGISLDIKDIQVAVRPSRPVLGSLDIPLDPLLCGFLLAISHPSYSKVSLHGSWPDKTPQGERILDLLGQCAVNINIEENKVTAVRASIAPGPYFDFSDMPGCIPLAFPLAVSTCKAESIEIILPPEAESYDIISDILTHIGYNYSVHSQGIKIASWQKSLEKNSPWNSPDPYWTLGYCLLSFKHKGICLANPGNVTTLWPGFWKIFTNLSGKRIENREPQKNTEGESDGKQSRRRIRV